MGNNACCSCGDGPPENVVRLPAAPAPALPLEASAAAEAAEAAEPVEDDAAGGAAEEGVPEAVPMPAKAEAIEEPLANEAAAKWKIAGAAAVLVSTKEEKTADTVPAAASPPPAADAPAAEAKAPAPEPTRSDPPGGAFGSIAGGWRLQRESREVCSISNDGVVTWHKRYDFPLTQLTLGPDGEFGMTITSTTYTGRLEAHGSQLRWSDGDVWYRVQPE